MEHFLVCGLSPSEPLCTVHGEVGYLGISARYKAHLVESLPNSDASKKLSLHLQTVSPWLCKP